MRSWVDSHELLEFIRASLTDDLKQAVVALIDEQQQITWVGYSSSSNRLNIAAQPTEFFINAQQQPTEPLETLVEQVCNTLSDICCAQRVGLTDTAYYITL